MEGKTKRTRRQTRGFTLLEVMIALVILTFAMMAVLSMVLQGTSDQQAAREQQTAREAAMARIEQIKSGAFTSVPSFNNQTFVVEGLSDQAQSDRKARGSVAIDSSNPRLYDILVTVSWKGRKGASSYSMRSLVAQ